MGRTGVLPRSGVGIERDTEDRTGRGSCDLLEGFQSPILKCVERGTFFDPRLDDPTQFPVAAKARLGHTTNTLDRVTSKLASLHFYQLAIAAPAPPRKSFDEEAAERGKDVFNGIGKCASSCHVPPIYTEPGWNMHSAEEIMRRRLPSMRKFRRIAISHDLPNCLLNG
jgi:hypothetical protein